MRAVAVVAFLASAACNYPSVGAEAERQIVTGSRAQMRAFSQAVRQCDAVILRETETSLSFDLRSARSRSCATRWKQVVWTREKPVQAFFRGLLS